ncbi:MAG: glycosyltransferase [Pseudomonadota bacterium]
MRVAIIHYWLVGMRGGEKVLEEISSLYPQADIFTHVVDRRRLSPGLAERRIQESFIARLPFARRAYKAYLGFMPRALEALDLSGYDLVISSESGPAKGVLAPPGARHICYCHSPMRYLWDQFHDYARTLNPAARAYFCRVAHRMRIWDAAGAMRVDRFLANSAFVAGRVRRAYGRRAEVLHPPVDLSRFEPSSGGDEYLFVSELTAYKRADAVIEAFRRFDRRLTVVGDGPDMAKLRRIAPSNVTLLGRLSDEALARAYANARALIFPAEEDFGIVPLEAMASGRPVLALGKGGALETVAPGETGLFFESPTTDAIRKAIIEFESRTFEPHRIRAHAERFSIERFREGFSGAVNDLMAASPAEAWR